MTDLTPAAREAIREFTDTLISRRLALYGIVTLGSIFAGIVYIFFVLPSQVGAQAIQRWEQTETDIRDRVIEIATELAVTNSKLNAIRQSVADADTAFQKTVQSEIDRAQDALANQLETLRSTVALIEEQDSSKIKAVLTMLNQHPRERDLIDKLNTVSIAVEEMRNQMNGTVPIKEAEIKSLRVDSVLTTSIDVSSAIDRTDRHVRIVEDYIGMSGNSSGTLELDNTGEQPEVRVLSSSGRIAASLSFFGESVKLRFYSPGEANLRAVHIGLASPGEPLLCVGDDLRNACLRLNDSFFGLQLTEGSRDTSDVRSRGYVIVKDGGAFEVAAFDDKGLLTERWPGHR